jgi:hypothetical protein
MTDTEYVSPVAVGITLSSVLEPVAWLTAMPMPAPHCVARVAFATVLPSPQAAAVSTHAELPEES